MKSIISELRNDPRFNHVTTTTLIEIAEAVMVDKIRIFEIRFKDTVPDGLWYSGRKGQRIYVIETGDELLRPVHNPNLIISREHAHLKGIKKLPKYFKHLIEN